MLQVKLGEKTYHVNYVSAIALRETGSLLPILNMRKRIAQGITFGQDLDQLIQWFCLLFNQQFSPEDVYAYYPADCLLRDIFLALMAVKNNVSCALVSFPTKVFKGAEKPE